MSIKDIDAGPYPRWLSASLVLVEWEDATNIGAWQDREEILSLARDGGWRTQNVGWLVWADVDCVLLVSRRDEDGEHFGLAERIPRRAITRIEILQEPDGRA